MRLPRCMPIVLLAAFNTFPLVGIVQASEEPTILVWGRDVSPAIRSQHKLAWSLLEHDYALRFFDSFPQPLTDSCQPRRITSADLANVDTLVLSDWAGVFFCGNGEINANMTGDEVALVERFVARGGNLLVVAVPVGRSEEDNLPDLLARFGLRYAQEPSTDTRHGGSRAQGGFRVYRDWLAIINRYHMTRGLPAYITSTNTWTNQVQSVPAQNYPQGWLTTALAEVNREPQIEALCWFVDSSLGGIWDAFSLRQHPGRLNDVAEEFDQLLQE